MVWCRPSDCPEKHAYDPPKSNRHLNNSCECPTNSNTKSGIVYDVALLMQFVSILLLDDNEVCNAICAGDADEIIYQLHYVWLNDHIVFYQMNHYQQLKY